ncbi:MAG: HAMP domain-containing histidine kinase [Clostridiales bacterium]|nr:HAMP domain-containing histidine kinase [Clostridiales bacterium]
MFKKSRKKIVAAIMLSLVLFLGAVLCTIYASSYYEIKKQNTEMLERYASSYTLNEQPGKMNPEDKPFADEEPFTDKEPPKDDGHMFRHDEPYKLSTFYSAAFSESGGVLKVDNGKNDFKSEDDIIEYAQDVLSSGKSSGRVDNLMYMTQEKDGYTLVAFIDSTVTDNSMSTMLRNILILGGASIVILFFLSVFLAKKIVKPLEENDKRQKQFVSDAGHELKTPVSVISANAELLTRQIGENEWLSNIQYENERMGVLIKQLLSLSRAENSSFPMEKTDFSKLVTGGELPFESVAFEKGLAVNCDIEDNIYVSGNSAQLSQLVAILLDNAISHSKGSNEIELKLKAEHHNAVLTVINAANEIPKEKLEHIFERFYRIDEVRNDEDNHYGLGLSIAKAITDAHKGSIKASYHNGKAVFTVQLPIVN